MYERINNAAGTFSHLIVNGLHTNKFVKLFWQDLEMWHQLRHYATCYVQTTTPGITKKVYLCGEQKEGYSHTEKQAAAALFTNLNPMFN